MEYKFRTLNADEIDCRIATISQKGLSLLLYKDARVDQNILDETVGCMNWMRHHSRDNANCVVSIWDNEKKQWIEKEDTGTESFTEKEKGLASDSFKRACFNWGIGRELYSAPFIWISSEDANIKQGGNGKFQCFDKFVVEQILYDEKRNIVALSIKNATQKKRVFLMDVTGVLKDIQRDWQTDKFIISVVINEKISQEMIDKIKDCKLSIILKRFRKKRSLDANGLLWHCLGEIAKSMNPPVDKWDVYLDMLKSYGKFTYICVKPNMVEAMKKQWRECEVVGDIDINGKEAVQMLCYFGSSTYDTKEFSVLLDGVISEMAEMGLETPASQDIQRALEQWEKMHEKVV